MVVYIIGEVFGDFLVEALVCCCVEFSFGEDHDIRLLFVYVREDNFPGGAYSSAIKSC